MSERRHGPVPATHTGICPRCRQRKKVSPVDGHMRQHGPKRNPCQGWRDPPIPGTLEPFGQPYGFEVRP
jgi:hypothetical protein